MTDFISNFGVYDFLIRDSLILVLLGLSVYVMLNAGLFAVPQIGFMAIGAYTSAILATEFDLPFAATVSAAVAMGALSGVLLGLALARLDGVYLAIATIGFSEMIRVTIRNLDITGGPTGLVGIARSVNDVYIVAILSIAVLILFRLSRTRFGVAMTAMREDQLMASHQGINIRRYRIMLFVMSGVLAAVAGALRVHLNGFVEPTAFSFDLLIQMLTATVLGGMATVIGPVVGAGVVFGLLEMLRSFEDYRNMINGALILLVIAFTPSGIAPLAGSLIGRVVRVLKTGRRTSPAPAEAGSPSSNGAAASGGGGARPAPGLVAADIGAGSSPADDRPVLTIAAMSKRFGGVQAVNNVGLVLERGEAFGLIGPNGSGKTTLLNLLSGVYTPDTGVGQLGDVDLNPLWGRAERLTQAGIARTFQNIRLLEDVSVIDNVRVGAYLRDDSSVVPTLMGLPRSRRQAREVDELVHAAIDLVGISRIVDEEVDALPYGLKRKVEIARALVRGPSLLLLDEPTAGMTPTERDEIFELVQTIRSGGTTVVVVEHDVASITKHCERVAVLNFGEVIAIGPSADVVAKEVVIDAYIGRVART